jgi:competence protein ComGC
MARVKIISNKFKSKREAFSLLEAVISMVVIIITIMIFYNSVFTTPKPLQNQIIVKIKDRTNIYKKW